MYSFHMGNVNGHNILV